MIWLGWSTIALLALGGSFLMWFAKACQWALDQVYGGD